MCFRINTFTKECNWAQKLLNTHEQSGIAQMQPARGLHFGYFEGEWSHENESCREADIPEK